MTIVPARWEDLPAIVDTLRANREDPSLFQQPPRQPDHHLREFLIAWEDDRVVGCIQVHTYPGGSVEILAVAVHPSAQGRGVGTALMDAAVARARTLAPERIWLGTAKPGYFARHGFEAMSRWTLPLVVLLGKLRRIAQQPVARWLPALFGRHVLMRLPAVE
ncbi:MAG: GNAT family N-acetyltransferase [Proteobacteria bacterium]|nr:GNAT family N-acetyltransferase [Pseudomonadota bacterium]MCP4916954.1 GNAT family N-acetyltransferase [Pseudomonadota bacterium]